MAASNGSLGRRERQLLESESRWLQKALFALSKAGDERAKLESEEKAEALGPLRVEIKGSNVDLATVRGAMEEAVVKRAERLRERLKKRHPILQ